MNRFLMKLERINPEWIIIIFPLTHIRKVHLPQVNFSGVGSANDKAFWVHRESVNVFIFGSNSKIFWSQLKHVNLRFLRTIWTLTRRTCCVMISDSSWLSSSLEMSLPCSPSDLVILFLDGHSQRFFRFNGQALHQQGWNWNLLNCFWMRSINLGLVG